MRCQGRVVVRPDGVGGVVRVHPVHLHQVSGHALAGEALGQHALQGKDDERQLHPSVSDQHQMKHQRVAGVEHVGPGGGGLQHVGVGNLAEVLQRVRALGWRRGFKHQAVGASGQQRAARAIGLARHAGHLAQGSPKLAPQQGARVIGQGQRLLHKGGEAVAGDGEGGEERAHGQGCR